MWCMECWRSSADIAVHKVHTDWRCLDMMFQVASGDAFLLRADTYWAVGVRSMLYGSMLGLLGAAVLGTLAARYMGLSSLQDLRPSPDSEGSTLQKWLQPYKERIQARHILPTKTHSKLQSCVTADLPGKNVDSCWLHDVALRKLSRCICLPALLHCAQP